MQAVLLTLSLAFFLNIHKGAMWGPKTSPTVDTATLSKLLLINSEQCKQIWNNQEDQDFIHLTKAKYTVAAATTEMEHQAFKLILPYWLSFSWKLLDCSFIVTIIALLESLEKSWHYNNDICRYCILRECSFISWWHAWPMQMNAGFAIYVQGA